MTDPTQDTLTQRLDRLERQWRRVAATVALIVTLLMLITQAQSQPVTVTIGELVRAPERYAGKEVAFDGVVVASTELYTVGKSRPIPPGQRVQLAVADVSGAQILIIAYVPSYDLPSWSMVGKTATAYSVRGIFYHVPVEPGPPLQFVVVPGKGGLKRK